MDIHLCVCACICNSVCVCYVCIEVLRLHEQVCQLREELQTGEQRRQVEVSALQQRAVRLEEQLLAAQKECAQKDQVTPAPHLNSLHLSVPVFHNKTSG